MYRRRGAVGNCMNGAAARKILEEKIIILSFIYIEYKEALEYRPK